MMLVNQNGGNTKSAKNSATRILNNLVPGHTKAFWVDKKTIAKRYYTLIEKWGLGAALLFPLNCPELPLAM